MGKYQMNNDKLTLNGIIGAGVLATSLVIGVDATYATMLEPELYLNSENPHEIILKENFDYFKNIPNFSFQSDQIKIGMNIDEEEPTEIEVIEIPVVKKMVFHFNEPVKLEFS